MYEKEEICDLKTMKKNTFQSGELLRMCVKI